MLGRIVIAFAIVTGSTAAHAQQWTVEPLDDPAIVAGEIDAPLEAGDSPELDAAPLFGEELTDAERAAYAEKLRALVAEVRGKVVGTIAARIEAKQGRNLGRIAFALFLVSLAGLLLLLAPLVLRRRYPNQGRVLFAYSALAALLFFVAINLFAGVVLTMRGAQAATGSVTNPQIQVVEATFNLLDEKAGDMADIGPQIIDPTIAGLSGETGDPVLVVMLDNVQKLASDVKVFASVGRFFKRLDFLFGVIPLALIGIAMVLVFQAARPTLVQIVRLPAAAAAGARGAGREVVAGTLRAVWAELRATLCVVAVLVCLTLAVAALIGFVLEPAIEIFLAYLSVSLLYVQTVDGASSFWVLSSLMGSVIFLVVNLIIAIAASALYLSKSQKLFQARFRDGVPLRRYAGFWRWGTVSVGWALALPVLYILVAEPAVGWLVVKMVDTGNWPLILGGGPALFLISFGVVFWAARGVKALAFIATYDPSPRPPAEVAAAGPVGSYSMP